MFSLLTFALLFSVVFGDYFGLPVVECGGSHYEFGYCIGQKTVNLIKKRFEASQHFQDLLWWVTFTQNGSDTLNAFVNTNEEQFPEYFDEIYGMSNGSNIDLTLLLVFTFDDELSYFSPNFSEINTTSYTPHSYTNQQRLATSCSDYLLQNYNEKNELVDYFIAHNEDNLAEDQNVTFLVFGTINNNIPFTAYNYAGELLTQAFGYNDYITFSSDFVHPANPVYGGIGRNFIGRSLLDSTNLQSAMKIVSQNGQCGGHNYQICEWRTGNMTGAEVAYDALHQFTLIDTNYNWTYHANRYIHLNISQVHDEDYVSSEHREARAAELGRPANLAQMLDFLGDEEDEEYPIYKTGPDDYTLHTYGVDLKNCQYQIYGNNPKDRNVIYQNSVNCKNPQ